MLYTVNPTLEIKDISFEEDCSIFDHYHKNNIFITIAELALLCDTNWPVSYKELLEISNDFIDGDESEIINTVNTLINSKLIVIDTEDYVQAANYWINNGWAGSLFYHLSSQQMEHWDDVHHKNNDLEKLETEFEDRYTKDEITWHKNELKYTRPSIKSYVLKKELIENGKSFDQVLQNRSSFKPFTKDPITLNEISHLLWASNMLNHKNRVKCFKEIDNNPSLIRSSLFTPLEFYIYVRHTDNSLKCGLYHFNVHDFTLNLLSAKDNFDQKLLASCAGQSRAIEGSISILITAHIDRMMNRYQHPRAYRTLMVNIGEMAQNFLMNATYLDKSYFISPAILDKESSDLLELENSARCLYLISVG